MDLVQVEADLYYVSLQRHDTEASLLAWLKTEAAREYHQKGFDILGFELLHIDVERSPSDKAPHRSLKSFFHSQKKKVAQKEAICARVKMQLRPIDGLRSTSPKQLAEEKEKLALQNTSEQVEAKNVSGGLHRAEVRGEPIAVAQHLVMAGQDEETRRAALFLGSSSWEGLEETTVATLPVSIALFLDLFVAKPQFQELYHAERGDTEISIGEWNVEQKVGNVRRNVYRIRLNGPIGPETTLVEEKQRYELKENQLTIQSFLELMDAPYGDHFHVESAWTVRPHGMTAVTVSMRAGAIFVKEGWFKPIIAAKAAEGVTESQRLWIKLARDKIRKLGVAPDDDSSISPIPIDREQRKTSLPPPLKPMSLTTSSLQPLTKAQLFVGQAEVKLMQLWQLAMANKPVALSVAANVVILIVALLVVFLRGGSAAPAHINESLILKPN